MTISFFRSLIAVALCFTTSSAVARPGDLDTSFGSAGIVISSHGGQSMFGPAVKMQPDGKIVVVGKDFNGNDDDFLVQRFLATGSPDTAFGTNGATVIKLSSRDDNAKGLAFQPDGKIVVAGGSGTSSYETSALVRVSADGVLDTSFGTGGKVLIDFGLPSHSHSVVVQSDGKIVVTGETYTSSDGGLFATARVLTSGVLDTSFGTGGKVTQDFGSGANAHALVLQADGKLLIGGYATNAVTGRAGFVVARFLSNGTLDGSFGSNGSSTVPVGTGNNYCHTLMLQSDGKIILAGSALTATTNYDFALLRFNTNGALDTSFGSSGIVTTNFVSTPHPSGDETAGGVIQADDKIIVGGYSNHKFALARYLSSGAVDSSFGTGGLVTAVIGTDNDDWIKSLALQSWDGKIVAAGYSKNGSTFNLALARFSGDNIANPGFSLLVAQGWNLLGNGINLAFPVASLYANSNWVNSVWKWDAAQNKWQFYTPSMESQELQAYAAGKGYDVLSQINAGDGYWVNAKIAASVMTQPGDTVSLAATNLTSGWHLLATGETKTAAAFNAVVASTTLWVWDTVQSKWYFYAPSLQAQGGTVLSDYIKTNGYLDFTSASKTLGPGVGFWVNVP